jgi:hypothetical protein
MMKQTFFILAATLIYAGPVVAEDRATANTNDSHQLEMNERSFFEPKTLADVAVMFSMDQELETSPILVQGEAELN